MTDFNDMTFVQAKKRAAGLAGSCKLPMAVVHCGSDSYVVKNAFLAARHYPQDIQFVSLPNGWRDADREKIANGTFGK